MSILPPDSLETALSQAQQATQAALQEGKNRLQIEILLPDLNAMAFAAGYLPLFEELGRDLKVFLPMLDLPPLPVANGVKLPIVCGV